MVLLDTCALLWFAEGQDQLSTPAKQALKEGAAELRIASISALEIGLLSRKGTITLPLPPETWFHLILELLGIQEIPVTGAIGLRSVMLPQIHKDPFDRIIIATAQTHNCSLITSDGMIRQYPDTRIVW